MTIRRSAKAWLAQLGVELSGRLYTSKLFSAKHSWTGAPAWWIQIPLERLDSEEAFEIVCESEMSTEFRHLTVPSRFLKANIAGFGLIGEKAINLFLSAEASRRFVDLRGPGRVDFSPFVREHP